VVLITLRPTNKNPALLALNGWKMARGDGGATGALFLGDEPNPNPDSPDVHDAVPLKLTWLIPLGLENDAVPSVSELRADISRWEK